MTVRLTPASTLCALLPAALVLIGGAGVAHADPFGITLGGQVGACCSMPEENATYTTGSGLTIATTGGSVTPTSIAPGLTSASLNVSAPNGSVTSSGGLASGAFHLAASSSSDPTDFTGSLWNDAMNDVLTFHVAGGGSASVRLSLALDGSVSVPIVVNNSASYNQTVGLSVTGAAMTVQAGQSAVWYPGPFSAPPVLSSTPFAYTSSQNYGFTDTSLTNVTTSGFDWSGTLSVTDGEQVDFELTAGGGVSEGATADFSNTLQFSLADLPSGVTYTSASNAFLTAGSTSAVPEPAPLGLLALGAGGLWTTRRLITPGRRTAS